jgi:hypothetical protein
MIKQLNLSWTGNVAGLEKMRNTYRNLVEKREAKRSLGGRGRGWEDNIKIGLKDVWYD